MLYDPENHVVKLCAKGMELEGAGKPNEALDMFMQAWNKATNDFEKFTAAHYVARHQPSVQEKLNWDTTALELALKLTDNSIKGTYPSLYLNVAKCFEDLQDFPNALKNYELANAFTVHLSNDGYGNLIKNAIKNGLERTRQT